MEQAMKRITGRAFLPSFSLAGALALAALLAGCGGGGTDTSSEVSTPSMQVAAGTVTGFGSVFVDGVELDDTKAMTVVENENGETVNTLLRLGERVRVHHDGQGVASRITAGAAAIGPVSAIDGAAGTLTVAAQFVTTIADPAIGPVTAYGGGYTQFADIQATDLVEVHGVPVYDDASQRYVVQATRIQKLTVINAVRVEGIVESLDDGTKTFSVGGLLVDYAAATVAPLYASLSEGDTVVVYGPVDALVDATLAASRVRLVGVDDAFAGTRMQLGGLVGNYDASSGTFTLGGTMVRMGTATVTPVGRGLANNAYVHVAGTMADDGSVVASGVHIRVQGSADALATIRLVGNITDFEDVGHFVVRSVAVDATGIDAATACPGVTLDDGVMVNVVATQQPNTDVVLAVGMTCMPASVHAPVRTMIGVAGDVVAGGNGFMLTLADSTTLMVQWNAQTAFAGLGPADGSGLAGQHVRIEGYQNGDAIMARVIRLDGSLDVDQYRPQGSGWTRYMNRGR